MGCSRRSRNAPLRKAAQYLWSQQGADGGFHSSTYGLLRSGQSLTPLALGTLMDVPEGFFPAPPGAIDRAIAFIRKNTNSDGALGRMDASAEDYPNYATALAVTALLKAQEDTGAMVPQLRSQQFSEANGWTPKDAPYGGWGMGGPLHRPPDAGHVDLSMTRCVMEALRNAGVPATDPAMKRALVYLERSQNADGGFYFSTVNPETNKAGEDEGRVASYGTATADGFLALRAAGVPDTDNRIVRAMQWLKEHHQPDRAPGFEGTRHLWGLGLRFYYADVISRAMPTLPLTL